MRAWEAATAGLSDAVLTHFAQPVQHIPRTGSPHSARAILRVRRTLEVWGIKRVFAPTSLIAVILTEDWVVRPEVGGKIEVGTATYEVREVLEVSPGRLELSLEVVE